MMMIASSRNTQVVPARVCLLFNAGLKDSGLRLQTKAINEDLGITTFRLVRQNQERPWHITVKSDGTSVTDHPRSTPSEWSTLDDLFAFLHTIIEMGHD